MLQHHESDEVVRHSVLFPGSGKEARRLAQQAYRPPFEVQLLPACAPLEHPIDAGLKVAIRARLTST